MKKQAVVLDAEEFADRAAERVAARSLDKTVDAAAGSRQAADRDRAFPRAADQEMSNPRKARPLEHAGVTRTPLASRQVKDRNRVKTTVIDGSPRTTRKAVWGVSNPEESGFGRINDALSDNNGDAQLLDDADRREVQRVDRFIQAYENQSGREHRVYVPVALPEGASTAREVGSQVKSRSLVEFDRFSFGTHNMHELDAFNGHNDVVFEVQTRRGAYMGRSDSMNDTRHLLPRAMQLRIVGTRSIAYTRPDGTNGQRLVVQARDMTETKQSREARQKRSGGRR